jgi:hypothetical protein
LLSVLLSVQPDILQYQETWNPANRTAHLGFSVIVSDSVLPKIRLISMRSEVQFPPLRQDLQPGRTH